jgi:hypothetical protein
LRQRPWFPSVENRDGWGSLDRGSARVSGPSCFDFGRKKNTIHEMSDLCKKRKDGTPSRSSGAEAHIDFIGGLRGAEAPLFHETRSG